jgi:cohesin complex subunit SA-1/2
MSLARLPLMESSDNNATPSPSAAESRRRSGRVVRAPRKFTDEVQSQLAARRKRARENDDDAENEDPNDSADEDLSDDGAGDASDGDDDELEPRQKKAKSRSKTKKPAAKKPKVNGSAPAASSSAQGAAVRLPNRPKKTVRLDIGRREGDGLYGEPALPPLRRSNARETCFFAHANLPKAEIFGSGNSSDDVAAHWFQRYQENDAQALTDLINCVLLATGCDQHLTEDDIRDPENSANRLSELEEAFEQVGPTHHVVFPNVR